MNKKLSLVLIVLLSACSYSPVYKHTKESVAQVEVGIIKMLSVKRLAGERRVAQLVNKRLSQVFVAGESSKYTLSADIEESETTLAILRDATEDRLELSLEAVLVLKNEEGEEIFNKDLSSTAPYNVETSPYGTEAGKDRARKSAAISLAEEIITQVNYFLYTQR